MEQQTNNVYRSQDSKNKIYAGLTVILLSPLLGAILFEIFTNIVGQMIATDGAVEMFWFSCIFATVLFGISLVLFGCAELIAKAKEKDL